MKFNWGHGITIAIIVCVLGLMTPVYLSMQQDIELVTEEYYAKELLFEKDIQKIKNFNKLKEDISIRMGDSVYVQFPAYFNRSTSPAGQITFYRPSDEILDVTADLNLNDSLYMAFPVSKFRKGKYEVIIDWKHEETPYLLKQAFIIW